MNYRAVGEKSPGREPSICANHPNAIQNKNGRSLASVFERCDRVYKPGSVSTVIYLAAALPRRSSHLLGSSRAGLASSTVLLRIEFTAMDASTPSGALLPHLSTLTSDEAVYLCCTFPEVAFGGRYPLFLPCGARTFLMCGLWALHTRLSDPVAGLFYFIFKRLSNELQISSRVIIIRGTNPV